MKLFLFDFDGVLVESLDIYYRIVRSALEKINMPLTRGREEFLELFEGNFYESLVARGVDLNSFFAASAGMLADVKYSDLQPVTAMRGVVEELQKNNILLIISSNSYQTIQAALKQFKVNDYFKEVLGSDFLLSKKDKIFYATKKYQIVLADSYYIGDTTGDIKESRDAGVKTVGITWGWHSKEKMAQARPDYLLDRPQELLQLN